MRLHALGSNGSFQLGLGHDEDLSIPTTVTLPPKISSVKQIACGGNHTLLLDSSGQVFATGSNAHGQCGAGSDDTIAAFRSIGLEHITLCAAAWEASFFATSDGRVLVCGTGTKGELGLGEGHLRALEPTAIPHFPPAGLRVRHLAACMSHVIAVLSDGTVYGWGAGRQGQLGSPEVQVWSPRRLDVGLAATHAVCGKDFTFVYRHGLSAPASCLLGPTRRDPSNLAAAVRTFSHEWSEAKAGWSALFFALPGGDLVGYGKNDHGQLPTDEVPSVSSFAAGSEHVVAITTDNRVIAWGWGEHGNCGLPIERASSAWNELQTGAKPVQVFAGCATSWIMTTD